MTVNKFQLCMILGIVGILRFCADDFSYFSEGTKNLQHMMFGELIKVVADNNLICLSKIFIKK